MSESSIQEEIKMVYGDHHYYSKLQMSLKT